MIKYWQTLKPTERRWVVFAGMIVFIMLNYFFIWPHRHDWGDSEDRMQRADASNTVYRAEIRHKLEYQRKLNELQSDGSSVVPEDQAIDFVHFYSSRAIKNKVVVTTQGQLVTHTNDFFLEQQMGISVQANETNLVNFLYSLGAGNSMMRVRAMNLRPDGSHQQITAGLTLVASYQKASPATNSLARPTRGAPAEPKPVVAATPKPAEVKPATVAPAIHSGQSGAPTNRVAGPMARHSSTNRTAPINAKKP